MQRTGPWDSPVLHEETNAVFAVAHSTGLLDVSRWGYLGGYDFLTNGDAMVDIQWFADGGASVGIGERRFQLSTLIPGAAMYRLPNLGPFAHVTWTPISGGNVAHSDCLIGTNRTHPLEMIPAQPTLVDLNAVALAGSATVTNYPASYYAGPLHVHYFTGQAGQLNFQYLTAADAWDNFDVVPIVASTHTSFVTVVPPGAWRVQAINNTAVATTFNLQAVPSLTGAS